MTLLGKGPESQKVTYPRMYKLGDFDGMERCLHANMLEFDLNGKHEYEHLFLSFQNFEERESFCRLTRLLAPSVCISDEGEKWIRKGSSSTLNRSHQLTQGKLGLGAPPGPEPS